ncbi:MAG: 2OG-Fe(II) oxygenase family protein [Acidimicrobiia bacterium]
MSESPVRTIDLEQWRTGDDVARAAVAAEFGASMQEAGFVVVTNHGIPSAAAAALRAAVLEFFALDPALKDRYRVTQLGDAGWVPYGKEANAYAAGEESPPDLKESFVATTADLAGHDGALPAVWPSEVPALREAARAWLEGAEAAHLELLRVAAASLGVDDLEHLAARAGHSHILNLNWYPPRAHLGPVADGQWRIGPHTDFGTLTLLDRQHGLGGLQVQLEDGSWVDAPWVPDALVVNGGDVLEAWSGGRWRSSPHRVLPPPAEAPDESLVSLIYFCDPSPEVMIAPLPGVDEPDAFEPFNAGDYLRSKLDQISV